MSSNSDQNLGAYEKENVVAKYSFSQLQNAEALAFILYAEEIRGKRLLDIGCGAGRTSFFLSQLTEDYVGVDYSAGMVEACRKRFPDTKFDKCDVRDMSSFSDGSFDTVVFSFNGLDSIDHADRLKGLAEIHRVLVPGGLFIFSAHNRDCEDKDSLPELQKCYNPKRLFNNIRLYQTQKRNRSERRHLETHEDEYAIINDPALDWSLLNYYITLTEQEKQLESFGFSVLNRWDSDGNPLREHDTSCKTTWIYYVARRSSDA